ncbi:hypothetical protein [Sporomusa malonica]|uniref:HNH endonuclease n=2 Tax=Sporomusa malonica TaxID=112901 RepID=A0A1W2AQL1_9FIRM|nr:hypothetical protein SAMN04488500_10648 [Sporomusa malonica]
MTKKPQGKCIFCGGDGLSKQHVWPEWLKNVIPRETSTHIQHRMKINYLSPECILVHPSFELHQGHGGVKKIRNVCRKCNSGWMSSLETKAKPILTSLILGEPITLDAHSQLVISAWSVMSNIMNEFTDQPTAAIPSFHRQILMESKRPAEGWNIWLGWYKGVNWKLRCRHHGFAAVPASQLINNNVNKIKGNTHVSTFVLGELMIYSMSSTLPNFNIEFPGPLSQSLRRIWPINQESIVWPPCQLLTDLDVNFIADAFCLDLMKNHSNRVVPFTPSFHP